MERLVECRINVILPPPRVIGGCFKERTEGTLRRENKAALFLVPSKVEDEG
jgi:hypothetical protein